MRPDEHRRKKNEIYKKKHNINAQKPQKKRESEEPKLASNADRYAEVDGFSSQPAGQNLREFLDTACSAQTGSVDLPNKEEVLDDSAGVLSLDNSAIAKAVGCFSLDELLGLSTHGLLQAELKEMSGDTSRVLSNYVETQMDPVYTVDHDIQKPLSRGELVYKNTGQWPADPCESGGLKKQACAVDGKHSQENSSKGRDGSASVEKLEVNEQALGPDGREGIDDGKVELEEWLDALLDE